jgi:hypothetical protein
LEIPIISNMIKGLKVFFKTRRYVAYTTIFVATTFLALYIPQILKYSIDTGNTFLETVLSTTFVYLGAAGTIYFGLGSLFTGLGLDNLWITRRGRGRVTELKGLVWIAVSFALAVFLGVIFSGPMPLLFFGIFCWLGWIGFQAFLSSRTGMRVATIVEPKKGGIAIGIGSFIVLIIGIGLIAAEALAALWLIPNNILGAGDGITAISLFSDAVTNLNTQYQSLLVAYAMMGLFALGSLIAFFKYARRGAALNIALLVVFIAFYAGYFLVNVMRRSGAPGLEAFDIFMAVFFLVYALSGIGTTITGSVENTRSRLRDLGPLLTFFLASGYFFVDTIISISTIPGASIALWFGDWTANTSATWVFRDVAKLIAFPIAALISLVYYLRTERIERFIERAREDGETFDPSKVDKDIADATPDPGESWASERAAGVKKGDQGHGLSAPDPHRMTVDDSRRLGKAKRLGDDDEDDN